VPTQCDAEGVQSAQLLGIDLADKLNLTDQAHGRAHSINCCRYM